MAQDTQAVKAGTIELIKKGSLQLDRVDVGEHHSLAKELPVADTGAPLTVAIWRLQGEGDLPFEYTYAEAKIVLEGKLVVKDEQGVIYRGEAGDIFIFHPPIKVTFLAESKGLVFYVAHSLPQ